MVHFTVRVYLALQTAGSATAMDEREDFLSAPLI
jgi:hypothetical protein